MKVILASNNQGKIKEMKQILEPLGYDVISQKDAGIVCEPDENGTTFQENALIKAKAIYNISLCPVIADDSGLEVDALDKRPGVYTARYGGHELPYKEKCEKLVKELEEIKSNNRTARFVCVICYINKNGEIHSFRGECEGEIGTESRGNNGFGFDPIFYIGEKSLAEISSEEKNKISHRAKALNKLTTYLKSEDNI